MTLDLLILGCGFTGRELITLAHARGWQVGATSRQPEVRQKIDTLGAVPFDWCAGSPLPCDAERIIVLFPPSGLDPQQVANAIGSRTGLAYCSSTSVYGPQNGAWVSESSPVDPRSPWAVARVAAEAAFIQNKACIVRAAGIYGEERSILNRARAGRLRVAGNLQRPVNMIHVHDLAEILIAATEVGEPGTVYLAASGRPVAWIDLARRAAELTKTKLPEPGPMPDDPNLRMFYSESKRCKPTRLQSLGITLRYPDTLQALSTIAQSKT
ncbi:MAG: NAD-dependent epimerase/dehydratase family protein [Myxococcota bacterium]|nr:NAD-dependent epimerase/dehydratase family protein [Myxococcota bacterium]